MAVKLMVVLEALSEPALDVFEKALDDIGAEAVLEAFALVPLTLAVDDAKMVVAFQEFDTGDVTGLVELSTELTVKDELVTADELEVEREDGAE